MHQPTHKRDVPVPQRMATRPRDRKGRIVPFFVGYNHGEPDFRTIAAGRVGECFRAELCWLCGQRMGAHRWFVVGPMCVANRLSSEPPSHYECARYAVEVCPHLITPSAKRRAVNLPEDAEPPPGIGVTRNPGAVVLWESRSYYPVRLETGMLFNLGEPFSAPEWWTEGRRATREEAEHYFEASVATLRRMALVDASREGSEAAVRQAERMIGAARQYLPAGDAAK